MSTLNIFLSILSENVLPLFFFCNTHYVVAPLCVSLSRAEFALAGPDCCAIWMGRIASPVLPSLNEWMPRSGPPLILMGYWWWWWWCWWWSENLQRIHRRKRSRSVEDDEEGHLIYHSGDILRARCIEYILFCIPSVSVVFFVSHMKNEMSRVVLLG